MRVAAVMRPMIAAAVLLGTVAVTGNQGASVAAACGYGCGGGQPLTYFGLGDSYSSGESNTHYITGSNLGLNSNDGCDRSLISYPEILAGRPLSALTGASSTNLQFIACSGAKTTQMTDLVATHRFHQEQSQLIEEKILEQSLNTPPDLITLTGGGDDANFTPILEHCIFAHLEHELAFISPPPNCGDDTKFVTETTNHISALGPTLQQNYATLAKAAGPHTSVLVGDYPQIFPSSSSAQFCSELRPLLARNDQSQLNSWGTTLNLVVSRAARADGLNFVNVVSTFKGHAICDSQGAWIRTVSQKNGVKLPGVSGFGSASFHPNPAGQQGYANAFASYIRNYRAKHLPLTPAGLPADTGSFGSFTGNILPTAFDTALSSTTAPSSPGADTATLASGQLTVTPSNSTVCGEQFNGGELVNITGSDYAPGAGVTLTIMPGTPSEYAQTVVADDSGDINTTLQMPAGLAGLSVPDAGSVGYVQADGAGAASTTQSDVTLFQVGDPATGCAQTPLSPATATVVLFGSDGAFLSTSGATFAVSGPGLPAVDSSPAAGTYAELDVAADESTVCPSSEPAGVSCHDGTLEGLTPGATYSVSEVIVAAGYQGAGSQTFVAPTDNSTATVAFTNDPLIDNYTTGSSAQSCVLCVLAPSGAGVLSASGTAKILWSGPATVNSTSSTATQASGSATLAGDSFYQAGQVRLTGTARLTAQDGPLPGSALDPFSWFTPPTMAGPAASISVGGSTAATATPGVYGRLSVSGNASLNLAPGTYVVTRGVDVSGSATLTGSGVTIYLACSSYPNPCANQVGAGFSVTGNAAVNLSFGAVGPSSGFAILADPTNHSTISATGSSVLNVSGTMEAPAATLAAAGNSSITAGNGEVVVGQLTASGSATITAQGDQVTDPNLN